jgi:hypothetical protein
MTFTFDHSAVSLVNITLSIPYLRSLSSAQRISSNSFKQELPSYQDYSSEAAPSFLSLIPLFFFALLLTVIVANIANKSSRFVQILDYFQLVAVTLYLDIQYPPVLESFLSGCKVALFALTKDMLGMTPYTFSPPKFIFYHTDTNLFRNMLILFLIFLLSLVTFLVLIALHTYKQHCKKAVGLIRYRWLNDLFSICVTPLFLFACQFSDQNPGVLAISVILLLVGVSYVGWISYKIIQVKKLS